jgi:hypothetical protein
MALFKNAVESHKHSLKTLNLLYEYDTFLDSLTVIADMGCGEGADSLWWANLETRDEPPEPHNYIVYAVDQDVSRLLPEAKAHDRIIPIESDYDVKTLPRKADLVWAHDTLQYSRDPFKTLAAWKANMNENGMLVISVPQGTYFSTEENRWVITSHSHQYYNYNLLSLIYMLAISGFDCNDAYFYKEPGTPWLYAAVYASKYGPLEGSPTWYDIADRGLINASLINSVQRNGYAKLEEVIVSWLDKNNYIVKD